MLYPGVVYELVTGIHYFGDAGLIICAKQGSAAGRDDVIAQLVLQGGVFVQLDNLRIVIR